MAHSGDLNKYFHGITIRDMEQNISVGMGRFHLCEFQGLRKFKTEPTPITNMSYSKEETSYPAM